MKVDERLREENLGGWAILSRQEVQVAFPEEYDRWCKGDIFESRGEREGLTAVARRGYLAVSETLSNSSGQAIAVVTHLKGFGPIRHGIANCRRGSWIVDIQDRRIVWYHAGRAGQRVLDVGDVISAGKIIRWNHRARRAPLHLSPHSRKPLPLVLPDHQKDGFDHGIPLGAGRIVP